MKNAEAKPQAHVSPIEGLALDAADAGASLGEATYRALCRALRTGMLRSGDRLREEEVARCLSVSRTPVREALGRLLARKLIEPAGGRGLIIRKLEMSEIFELYAMREILEGAAARLAAQQASAAEFDLIEHLALVFQRSEDIPAMERSNRQLHEAIFRAARNRFLDSAFQDMQDSLALLGPTTFGVKGRPEIAIREHDALVTALRHRDADQAEQIARAHMRAALKTRLKLVERLI